MKGFRIIDATNPLEELEAQKDIIQYEITNRLLVPHEQQLEAYEADFGQICKKIDHEKTEDDQDRKERRLEILKKSDEQFRSAHTTEKNVICSLVKQITHIVAAEIINRRPSQVVCDYKNNLFIIPIRYKN
jgi:hypothetical protein